MIGLLFPRRSIVCSVHEASHHGDNLLTRAEEMVFLREGFSWPVAIFPPLGLALRGAWLGLLVYAALAALLIGASTALGVNAGWAMFALIALGLVFGFEAPALERWRLSRSGWDEVGVVSGADMDECERRFFDAWMAGQAPVVTSTGDVGARPVGLLRRIFSARP